MRRKCYRAGSQAQIPSIDPVTVQQEADHLLYIFGCGGGSENTPPLFARSDNCAALQSVAIDRERYGILTPPEDQAALGRCGREPPTLLSQSNASQEEIQLERRGSAYLVPVRINQTLTLPFILDTGAEELVIPVDVALTLIRAGALTREDFIGKRRYTMTNGSEETQDRVVIREVQVGVLIARDVTAATSNPLLGESLLSQFGTVTIDYNRLVLILSR